MKRLISLLLVVGLLGLFSVRAFAATEAQALSAAHTACVDKTPGEAEAIFKTLLPTLKEGINRSQAQSYIAIYLYQQNKISEALVEFAKVSQIVDAAPADILNAKLGIGDCLGKQGKAIEAQEAYKSVLLSKEVVDLNEFDIRTLTTALKKLTFTVAGSEGKAVKMTADEKDTLLLDAYDAFIGSEQAITELGLKYLSTLVRMMSQKAQADFNREP